MSDLLMEGLPDLPQRPTLERIARVLWDREDVVALWLGGSFARDAADQYSDLDLRVAVEAEALDAWSIPDVSALVGETVVGGRSRGWEGTILHHLVLADGVILDLLVQGADRTPPEDATLILGCRDPAFAERLGRAKLPPVDSNGPAAPDATLQAIIDFWIGSHKHAKVLGRGLEMLVLIGLGIEQSTLMRLWYIEATGRDGGAQQGTIHSLTQTVRTVMEATGARGLETLGTARGSREEIIRAVERNRDEVARVGRHLADRLGFSYPEALERTVWEMWRQMLGENGANHGRAGKKLGAAAVIRDEAGRILLVKHSYGMRNWELPGGAAEADESVADTAARETREETGIRVTPERLTGIYYMAENDSHHFVYLCEPTHRGQEPCPDRSEITHCGYFPPDALPRPISDFTVQRLQDALAAKMPPLPIRIGPRRWLE